MIQRTDTQMGTQTVAVKRKPADTANTLTGKYNGHTLLHILCLYPMVQLPQTEYL